MCRHIGRHNQGRRGDMMKASIEIFDFDLDGRRAVELDEK